MLVECAKSILVMREVYESNFAPLKQISIFASGSGSNDVLSK